MLKLKNNLLPADIIIIILWIVSTFFSWFEGRTYYADEVIVQGGQYKPISPEVDFPYPFPFLEIGICLFVIWLFLNFVFNKKWLYIFTGVFITISVLLTYIVYWNINTDPDLVTRVDFFFGFHYAGFLGVFSSIYLFHKALKRKKSSNKTNLKYF